MAGKIHLSIFGIYACLVLLGIFVADGYILQYMYEEEFSNFQYIFADRIGIWVSGIAGLILIPERYPSVFSKMEEWSAEKKRLVFFSTTVFLGFLTTWSASGYYCYGWYNPNLGIDYLLHPGVTYGGFEDWVRFLENSDGWQRKLEAIHELLRYLLPFAFIATIAFAWFKHSKGDSSGVIMVGKVHFSIFGIYVCLVLLGIIIVADHCKDEAVSMFQHIFTDRIGIWVSGIAGLTLLFPEKGQESSGINITPPPPPPSAPPPFEDMDADGDGVLSKEEFDRFDDL